MPSDALIVIDMLKDFVCEDGSLYVGETVKNIIPEIQKKLSRYRAEKRPVIFVCDNHDDDDPEFEMFPQHCIAGSNGAEIHKDLRPNEGEKIIPKKRFSAFFRTDLEEYLKEHGICSLEICGVCTHICVLYTCADARARNIDVEVDRRCVDSFDRAAHDFALKEMERTLGANIV
ncbi:MAG TPA: isochorismatase family cysteine hydrolase [bacterium]|nr:isochorismatase family cysteine hydrolase [bacterium]